MDEHMQQTLRRALCAPFPVADLDWVIVASYPPRVQKAERNLWAAYVDARAVMDRLDDVVGPACWMDSYQVGPAGGVMCTLAVRFEDQWVTKVDGAPVTDIEPVKGGYSDALRRAAVKWGIGRYLYRVPSVWLPADVKKDDVGQEASKKLGTSLPRPSNDSPADIRDHRAARGSRKAGTDEDTAAPPSAPQAPARAAEGAKPTGFVMALRRELAGMDVDFTDLARFLNCLPEEVEREADTWGRDTRRPAKSLAIAALQRRQQTEKEQQ